jgi:hypothetical protein
MDCSQPQIARFPPGSPSDSQGRFKSKMGPDLGAKKNIKKIKKKTGHNLLS